MPKILESNTKYEPLLNLFTEKQMNLFKTELEDSQGDFNLFLIEKHALCNYPNKQSSILQMDMKEYCLKYAKAYCFKENQLDVAFPIMLWKRMYFQVNE